MSSTILSTADLVVTQTFDSDLQVDKTLSPLRETQNLLSGSRASLSTEPASFDRDGRIGFGKAQTRATMIFTEDIPPSTSESGGDTAKAQDRLDRKSNTHPPMLNTDWVCIEDMGHHDLAADLGISNVVIFGETGVGKSSIINLIAGKELATTSSEARGSKPQHQSYDGTLGGIRCRLWDTVGLNEGFEGEIPQEKAESMLKKLIQELNQLGALALLIYCVSSGRIKKQHQRNYNLFYTELCQKKVPIALVITNLEHEEEEMEQWWHRNEAPIRNLGMVFDEHACVTTDPNFEGRRLDSQERLRDLMFRTLQDRLIPNIIVIGEFGVGKSSVINLIAGQKLAHTPNTGPRDALHLPQSYLVSVNDIKCRLWSITWPTGTGHTKLESKMKEFLQRIAHTGGINLLMYCIRGARLTKAFRSSYNIFYSGICRKKVPIALVVTGLENEKNRMDAWWDKNEQTLLDYGMQSDVHACVTTLDLDDKVGKGRQLRSQKRLRDIIVAYSKYPPWKIGGSFLSCLFPLLPNLLRATPHLDKETTRTVIVYDMAPDSPPVTECTPGITTPISSSLIGDQRYEFIRVEKRLLQSSAKLRYIGGLLIFYTSPLVNTGIPLEDVEILRKFYTFAGGLMCPMLVVMRGCDDNGVAQASWDAVASNHNDIHGYPTSFSNINISSNGETGLMRMVSRLWVDPAGAQSPHLRKL